MIYIPDTDRAYSAKNADTKKINSASHLLEAGAASLAHIIMDKIRPCNAATSMSIDQIFKVGFPIRAETALRYCFTWFVNNVTLHIVIV